MRSFSNLSLWLPAFGLLLSVSVTAAPLSIRVEPPDAYKVLSGNRTWNVILDGEIDSGAPSRLAEALKRTGGYSADVYINSPGGSLAAGIEMGRLLRRAGANTHIGALIADPDFKLGSTVGKKPTPGSCHSACALAFLGGVYRYQGGNSKYGVHRFWTRSAPSKDDLDNAQIISAAITSYIREMDVDPALFDLMVQAGKDSIRILSQSELHNLYVVNNGRKRPEWTIEAVEGAQYLRGMQDSVYGYGKAVFFCTGGSIGFYSFYQAGEERAASIANGSWYHSLLVNHKPIPLNEPSVIKASKGELSGLFDLTREQVRSIVSGSSVGHAMQLAPDAPTFVGYTIDIPDNVMSRVRTFLRTCALH